MSPQAYETAPSAEAEGAARPDAGSYARLIAYVALGLASAGFFLSALTLPSSRWEPLGAGTFPAIVFGLMVALCLFGGISELLARKQPGAGLVAWLGSHRLVLFVFAAFTIYVLVVPALGFGLATFGFLLVTQLRLAPPNWRARTTALVLALAFSFGLEWVFAEAFDIFLPRAGFLSN